MHWLISFVLHGFWKIHNYSYFPIMEINNDKIITHTGSSIMSMRSTWKLESNTLKLDNLSMIQLPSDWMNIFKYKNKLKYYNYISSNGLLVDILSYNDSFIDCKFRIFDQDIKLLLEKIPSPIVN